MPIEFIGFVGNYSASETSAPVGAPLDLSYVETLAKVQEQGGFDRVLLAFHSTSPESILVAQHVAAVTTRLNLMIAHRPGFTAPTIAARQLATLDHISGGRVGVHVPALVCDVLAWPGDPHDLGSPSWTSPARESEC